MGKQMINNNQHSRKIMFFFNTVTVSYNLLKYVNLQEHIAISCIKCTHYNSILSKNV